MLTLLITNFLLMIGFCVTLYSVCNHKKITLFTNDNIIIMTMIFIGLMLDPIFYECLTAIGIHNFMYPSLGTIFVFLPITAYSIFIINKIRLK